MKDMNRDDKTVKMIDKRDETQAIMSKAAADDEAIKEKLNAVFRLRLLYNSGEELWKHIGKSGSGNNSFGRVGGKDVFYAEPYFTSWSVNGMTKRALFLMAC